MAKCSWISHQYFSSSSILKILACFGSYPSVSFCCGTWTYIALCMKEMEEEKLSQDYADLIAVASFTGSPAHKFNFQRITTSVFIPSSKPLWAETSLLQTKFAERPKFCWLVLVVPFKKETPGSVGEMDSFLKD